MSSWTNEAGEPIMSGEAWRLEQALDAADPPYEPDDYLTDDDDYDDEVDEDDEDDAGEGPREYDVCVTRTETSQIRIRVTADSEAQALRAATLKYEGGGDYIEDATEDSVDWASSTAEELT